MVLSWKYVAGLPSLKPVGGGLPELLVVRVVVPPCVTVEKVRVTGVVPVVVSAGLTTTFVPAGLLTSTLIKTLLDAGL